MGSPAFARSFAISAARSRPFPFSEPHSKYLNFHHLYAPYSCLCVAFVTLERVCACLAFAISSERRVRGGCVWPPLVLPRSGRGSGSSLVINI